MADDAKTTKSLVEAWAEREDQVLENLLRDHPELTQEKAVEQLKEAGFY